MESDKVENDIKGPFLENYEDLNSYAQASLLSVLQATKNSNSLPAAGDDYDYYTSFQSFHEFMDFEGKRILHNMQDILRFQGVKGQLSTTSLGDAEDVYDVLMDANDQILERVSNNLDEICGVKKREQTLVVAKSAPKQTTTALWNRKPASATAKSPGTRKGGVYQLLSARNVQRPQICFKDKVDNSERPFVPIIKKKPHAIKPLQESLKLPEGITEDMITDSNFVYPHPYQEELNVFTPSHDRLTSVTPQNPAPLSEVPLTLVSSVSELAEMVDSFRNELEIAVDLEHHSYRTFLGFTCLMQISTRSHDYIIDTLELRSDMHLLNDIFADPNILKVFHGSDSDIDWLQRDFGIYVVNMFDTGQAARVLPLFRYSLEHLLKTYCDVVADKQYQLADWRIRPLPDELVDYARADTHYLLYIYDCMRNQLIDKGNAHNNLLLSVMDRSKQICTKVYRKPVLDKNGHLEVFRKSKKAFNTRQMYAFKSMYAWRNRVARADDESIGYVLPNHMMLQIAEILPRERQGVLACCNPIPPLVRQYLNEVHGFVLEAREQVLIKTPKTPRTPSVTPVKGHLQAVPVHDPMSLLYCRHDFSQRSTSHISNSVKTDSTSSGIQAPGISLKPDRHSIINSPAGLKGQSCRYVSDGSHDSMKESSFNYTLFISSYAPPTHCLCWDSESQFPKTTDPSLIAPSSSMFPSTSGICIVIKEKATLSALGWSENISVRIKTVAQMKAAEVKSSFMNPFEMFYSGDTSRNKMSPSKTASPLIQPAKLGVPRWRLKKSTSRAGDEDSPTEQDGPPSKRAKVDNSLPAHIQQPRFAEDETDLVPLREQAAGHSNKAKKPRKDDYELPITVMDDDDDSQVAAETGFVPYDYSQANLKMFEGGPSKNKKNYIYDPNAKSRGGKSDKFQKSRMKMAGGSKSFTYSNKSSKHQSPQHWPKR